jgi:hypothetical protein
VTRRPNYVERVRDKLAGLLPDLDPALLDLYTLLALQYGHATDAVMVHNAWSVWRNRTDPDHRSLIPFPLLSPEVQALDEPYVEAIRRAEREAYEDLIRESGEVAG